MENEVTAAIGGYIAVISTANFAALGGLYKLVINHLTDRKLHSNCGKETTNKEG